MTDNRLKSDPSYSQDRRKFLRTTALGGLALGGVALGGVAIWGNPFAGGLFGGGGGAFAQERGPRSNRLAIPPLERGRTEGGKRVYDLNVQNGVTEFVPGVQSATRGVNGALLGPTLLMRAGTDVRLNVTNSIGETTTLHWHGFHLPAKMDGGPHQTIDAGQTWSPQFTVLQKASTFWYHPHLEGKTGEHVWQGIAGMIIVEDDEANALSLPRTYGVDDIPVVLQDRRFSANGTLGRYSSGGMDRMVGLLGNVPITNGTLAPFFEATTALVRLRLLNGANASIYNLGFSDNREFFQIGSDGGLLEAPYRTNRLILAPGERAEIIVDVSDGQPVMLTSLPGATGGMMGGGMMGGSTAGFEFLEIRPAGSLKASPRLPARLARIDRLSPTSADNTRRFLMGMAMGPFAMLGLGDTHTINGKSMKMERIDETVRLGTTEIWEIGNSSNFAHPFHVHDVQFQILDRDGQTPHPGERGLKDTVLVRPNETVRVIAKFTDFADPDSPYMYHCHILEHEDAGMMGQFVVV